MDPPIDVKMAFFINSLCQILLEDFSAHDHFYKDERTEKIIYLLVRHGFINTFDSKQSGHICGEIKNILEKWRTHAD